MIGVRERGPADAVAWDVYVLRAPGSHFSQRSAWGEVLTGRLGCVERSLIAERDGRCCGVLPLFEKGGAGAAHRFTPPGGLLADDEDVARAILERAAAPVRDGAAASLELHDQRSRWPGLETIEENASMILTLETTEEAQWKAFDAKLRNQIRKGQKGGFTVHRGHDQVEAFRRVMLENMRDLGTPIYEDGYYREVLERFGQDATIIVIRKGGEPAGGIFLVRHGDTLIDPWASSLRRFFAYCPNQLLYWEAIRFAITQGLAHFDFGRSQWNSNTYRFKSQWGAAPVPLYDQYVLPPGQRAPTVADQKRAFSLAVRIWQHLPLSLAGWLGPRVRRRFPEAL
jgi:serine/alanine adding enzyme